MNISAASKAPSSLKNFDQALANNEVYLIPNGWVVVAVASETSGGTRPEMLDDSGLVWNILQSPGGTAWAFSANQTVAMPVLFVSDGASFRIKNASGVGTTIKIFYYEYE